MGRRGRVYVYELQIQYPPGSKVPGWQPEGWVPEPSRFQDGDEVPGQTFKWPSERLFLSSGGAVKRARRLLSYGATVQVKRSLPVEFLVQGRLFDVEELEAAS